MGNNNSEKLPRIHKLTILLNEKEYKVLQKYITKYKITNKAKFVRQALFTHILEHYDRDYPTLFDDNNKS